MVSLPPYLGWSIWDEEENCRYSSRSVEQAIVTFRCIMLIIYSVYYRFESVTCDLYR